jgi:hypothetical protein
MAMILPLSIVWCPSRMAVDTINDCRLVLILSALRTAQQS